MLFQIFNLSKNYLLAGTVEFEAVFAGTTTAVFEFTATFAFTAVFKFVSTFAFESITAFVLVFATGAVSVWFSALVCKTEILPVKAGIASSKADSINVVAAAIVIFDKIVCNPRG